MRYVLLAGVAIAAAYLLYPQQQQSTIREDVRRYVTDVDAFCLEASESKDTERLLARYRELKRRKEILWRRLNTELTESNTN